MASALVKRAPSLEILRMRIILIGNYSADQQQSMERFALMLESGFMEEGHGVEVWRPCILFGRMAETTASGLGKWLGYLDKWLLFPLVLRWRSFRKGDVFYHICDHSNAPYLAHLPRHHTSITCHDVLAIRGAFDHSDAFCQSSRFGRILQRWILRNLAKSKRLAAVSDLTLRQLEELVPPRRAAAEWQVIHNAFNNEFSPMSPEAASTHLAAVGIQPDLCYILHVGSELPRKNRGLLLKMVAALGEAWHGKICFAGQVMDTALRAEAGQLGLLDRIVEVPRPDHSTLVALYSRCDAFVFPSYSEGFGWPVIEAQACGAPVLASHVEPMPEVSGGAAIHVGPDDARTFADALLVLRNPAVRADLIQAGFENAKRFTPRKMTAAYLDLMNIQ